MSDQHQTEAAETEELAFEVVKPLGGVISVRFNGEEMLQLREEVRRRNTTVSGLIKEATLTHIAYADLIRRAASTMQSPNTALLNAVWLTSSHRRSSAQQSENTYSVTDPKSLGIGEPTTEGLVRRRGSVAAGS